MKQPRYTINDFRKQFPNDDACLEYLFQQRYGKGYKCPACSKTGFYKVKARKCYACAWCGFQLHPTAGTIFHKSPTKLTLWFHAIFLFSASRNGVAAKELERQLGVTYKTAYRIGQKIRLLMSSSSRKKLSGDVEIDETYIGGRKRAGKNNKNLSAAILSKSLVCSAVERRGTVYASIAPTSGARALGVFLQENIDNNETRLLTDDSKRYEKVARDFNRFAVNHSRNEYARGDVHTNTIEGFWSQLKRSINGTYHVVSRKHLQSYVNEFSFRYNKKTPIFPELLVRLVKA